MAQSVQVCNGFIVVGDVGVMCCFSVRCVKMGCALFAQCANAGASRVYFFCALWVPIASFASVLFSFASPKEKSTKKEKATF
jgi:hypothetical protein